MNRQDSVVDKKILSYGDVVLFESDVILLETGDWLNDRLISFATEYAFNQISAQKRAKIEIISAPVCEMIKFMDEGLEYVLSDIDFKSKEMVSQKMVGIIHNLKYGFKYSVKLTFQFGHTAIGTASMDFSYIANQRKQLKHIIDSLSQREFTVRVPKKIKGEHFPRLDMITELLRPQRKITGKSIIEEIDTNEVEDGIQNNITTSTSYGFGWKRTGILEQLHKEIGKLIDLVDPKQCLLEERVAACAEYDAKEFDPERYLLKAESIANTRLELIPLILMKRIFPTRNYRSRSALLHVFCSLHSLLQSSGEFRYLLNDIYITDYCLWIQTVDDFILESLVNTIETIKVDKCDVGLDLDELEIEARLIMLDIGNKKDLDSDDESEPQL
uniref:Protein SHQ1 homolog n=1 Tax=Heterorhabditis bacteriophora TaxID=37862 RepID=A0A1I7XRB5_HETBA